MQLYSAAGSCWECQPTNAQAAEEVKPEFEISVTATVDRNESREVLRMVNEARAEAGVKPYVMSKEMEEAAITRAFELIANYSHGRPKGEAYYSIFPEYGIKLNYNLHLWSSENIAEGWIPDAESVMQMWKDSANHWYNITNQWSTHIGIACVQYQGSTYWVQIFARDPQNVTEAPKEGTDKNIETREYVVNANYISSKKPLIFTEETVELKPGESTEFDLELAKRNIFGGTSGFGKVIFTSLNPEHIIIPQEAPITVDQEGIHVSQDAKAGTYPLTIQVGNKKAVKNIIVSLCKHPQNSLTTEEKAPTCTEEGYRKTTCQDADRLSQMKHFRCFRIRKMKSGKSSKMPPVQRLERK